MMPSTRDTDHGKLLHRPSRSVLEIERFFEETLERAPDPNQAPPDNLAEVAARYAEAAPRYGIEFYT
jgi:hypothetical protein